MDKVIAQMVAAAMMIYLTVDPSDIDAARLKVLHYRIQYNRSLAEHYGRKAMKQELHYFTLAESMRMV